MADANWLDWIQPQIPRLSAFGRDCGQRQGKEVEAVSEFDKLIYLLSRCWLVSGSVNRGYI